VRAQKLARAAVVAGSLALAAVVVSYRVPVEDLAMAHFNLGNAFKERGQWQDAIGQYEASLQRAPAYISTWNNLALVYERSGADPKLALEAWQRVLQLAQAQGSGTHYERASRHIAAINAGVPLK
jgi:tetratricopeptide (TPR) repeat protein